ncbi:helix-turn-helix transcriptional regulator [Prolixibacteraceae bacterium Z1-6]|uniref:Helix-turn-helix transcriptional regulator n=1 Tax=Draconibacterium aestuarii TaxID=2998507 RepID=A0A9X3J8F7_9BACT|nr:helix-turn-helix transcriptional regulator [Prolixibacteraceae bacterium Z1-6]
MKLNKLQYGFLIFLLSFSAKAMEIKGTIDLQNDWQPVVYLASLNSPENLFVASPDFIIAETFIQPNGSFLIETSSIPADLRFYRLYLVKGNNSMVEFNTTTHRNYMHLLLDKNSSIEIEGKVENNTLSILKLTGSPDNNTILEFDTEVAKRKQKFTSDITKAKSNYLTQDLENYIRAFVRTQENSLVGLYALYHLEEKDTDFLKNSDFYFDFQKRIQAQYPDALYTQSYTELLEKLIGFRDLVCEIPGVQPRWKDNLLIAQSVVILLLIVVIVLLFLSSGRRKALAQSEDDKYRNSFSKLTVKEQEILKLLAEGKTNKEIAQELYVELSTVKTHINSIYKQLQLANRKEAVDYYKGLKLEG